jgi:hypothetical protein
LQIVEVAPDAVPAARDVVAGERRGGPVIEAVDEERAAVLDEALVPDAEAAGKDGRGRARGDPGAAGREAERGFNGAGGEDGGARGGSGSCEEGAAAGRARGGHGPEVRTRERSVSKGESDS